MIVETESTENLESERMPEGFRQDTDGPWTVYDNGQKINLPEGVKQDNVIVFNVGNGKLVAQRRTPQIEQIENSWTGFFTRDELDDLFR